MNPKEYDLVIYHKDCPDGIGAAWCFWCVQGKPLDQKKFWGGSFNELKIPNVEGKNVVFVDFSYKKEIIEKLLKPIKDGGGGANHILILDHHKTSIDLAKISHPNFSLVLDITRSGAQIAWDFVNENRPRPWYIDHIGDRDLWKWVIPGSKNTTKAMFTLGYYQSFEKFDSIQSENENFYESRGRDLNKSDEKKYAEICGKSEYKYLNTPDGSRYKVRAVECDNSQASVSDIGNILSNEKDASGNYVCDFAVIWRYSYMRDECWLSFRGAENSQLDLSAIAKQFGGGGHAKAAGATVWLCNFRTVLSPYKN